MTADELRTALRDVLLEVLPKLLARLAGGDADLLDVDAAAKRLGLKPATVYKRAAKCELPSVKLGARVLFRPADLDAYTGARRRSPERVKAIADHAARKEPP
jgi:excisionase family DNA binding protein